MIRQQQQIEQQLEGDFGMEIELDIPDTMENNSVEITQQGIKFFNADFMVDQEGIRKISQNVPIYEQFHIDPRNLKIYQVIGRGASSSVNRGIYRKDGKDIPVAVKSISAFEKSLRQQILNDLKTFLTDYRCNNLVKFYGCYYEAGHIDQVIEFMDLGSLRNIIKIVNTKGIVIPEEVLANMAINILNGLRYIHVQKHQIHRDIKPENILLNSKGQIKITDFGISKHLGKTHGMSTTFVGTLIYMSPQRIKPPTQYNFLSDIWSFGVIMYQLATGTNPYKFDKQKTPLDRILQILDQKEPQLPHQNFSIQFQSFIKCCLSKDPKVRWSTTELFKHEWIIKYNTAVSKNSVYQWLCELRKKQLI